MFAILVVDDRPTNREYIATLLRYGGNCVLEARDGEEGLAVAKAERPDLVIADIVMPAMDGYEFVRQIRQDPAIAETPVIFYTAGHPEVAARKLATACGVERILIKPSNPEEILATVSEVLGTSATAAAPTISKSFEREHLCLVTNRLSQKVNELEALNAGLEKTVAARTAELVTANDGLRSLNRTKDEFLAVVSHDLRSPLCGIVLMADMLRESRLTMSPLEIEYNLNLIIDASHHLEMLVGDLLDIAKIDSGDIALDLTEVRLGDVIDDSVKVLGFNARAKGVRLQIELPKNEPSLQADRLKLSQIFSNLIGNAIKFTPKEGTVRVSLKHKRGGVLVKIADTGRGIPAASQAHLFDQFTVEHALGTAGERGTGLGLSIVRRLVDLHGGRIEVESEVGQGSTFSVYLPYVPNQAPAPSLSKSAETSLPMPQTQLP